MRRNREHETGTAFGYICIHMSRSRRVHRVRRQGAEPNATFRVGADGETGDWSRSVQLKPRSRTKPGLFFEAMRIGVEKADMSRMRTRLPFGVDMFTPWQTSPPPQRPPRPPPPPPAA